MPHLCSDCHKPIEPYASATDYLSAEDMLVMSVARFGRELCSDCVKLNTPIPRPKGRKKALETSLPEGVSLE